MTKQRVSYTLDSTLETVDNAEQTATRIAAEAGFEEDEVMRISMAVREAAINAVLHGNAYDPGKKVKLDFESTPRDLVITISDQGKGLDMSKIFFRPLESNSRTVSRRVTLPSPNVIRPLQSTMLTPSTCRLLIFMLTEKPPYRPRLDRGRA